MKIQTLRTLFVLGLVFVLPLFASEAFAGVGDQPPGSPPFGLGVQGLATGTKLDGVLTIEFTNFTGNPANIPGPAEAALRLRKGSELKLVVASVAGPFDLTNLGAVQQAIIATLEPLIIAQYGGSNVELKAVDELKSGPALGSFWVVIDVTLAVQ